MSTPMRARWLPRIWVPGVAVIAAFCVEAALGQPHAEDPVSPVDFSVDRASPLNAMFPGAAASIFRKPGPTPLFTGPGLGLYSPMDDLDAFHYGQPAAGPSQLYMLLFSVDCVSIGGVPPDPGLSATGRIFSVFDQADRNQAAGDIFMSTDPFTRGGGPFTVAAIKVPVGQTAVLHPDSIWGNAEPVAAIRQVTDPGQAMLEGAGSSRDHAAIPRLAPISGRGPKQNNTLVSNQGDTGGVDQDLSPAKAPVQREATASGDNVNAAATSASGAMAQIRGLGSGFFFTVTADSPSLATLPGTFPMQSGADIFFDANPEIGGTEELYLSAFEMGLQGSFAGDDIDALVVFDDDGVFGAGDQVLFSLTRGSPSLTGQRSAADVFVYHYGEPTFTLFATAVELGLDPVMDDIDALTLLPTSEPEQTVYAKAVFLVWPGDFDESGWLEPQDCAAFPPCFSGAGVPLDSNGFATHVVSVGPGPHFNPTLLSIEVGDTVRWIWAADGMPHNVVSGLDGQFNGVFTSGPPTSVPGTFFEVTFDYPLLNRCPRHLNAYHYFSTPDFTAGMTGTIIVQPHPCACFDLDFDLDVDCNDWRDLQPVYVEATGQDCVPLSVEEFVAALLGNPMMPAHVCIADMNADGELNGLDVSRFVEAVLH